MIKLEAKNEPEESEDTPYIILIIAFVCLILLLIIRCVICRCFCKKQPAPLIEIDSEIPDEEQTQRELIAPVNLPQSNLITEAGPYKVGGGCLDDDYD